MTEFTPIGIIHTPNTEKELTPIQSARSDLMGSVEVFAPYAEGLEGIEEFSHIFLIYEFHRSPREKTLMVKPFLDDVAHGVFSTRFPSRPNPIGFSVVRLNSREANILHVTGVDMLDGTPLLDIKPYIPDFDVFTSTRNGWFQKRALE